jgi:hypothetical protein
MLQAQFVKLCLLVVLAVALCGSGRAAELSESDGGWKMPADCGANLPTVLTPRNLIEGNRELDKSASYPPDVVKHLFRAPDHSWQAAVESGTCDSSALEKYKITCKKDADGRQVFKFPPGSMFEITRQIKLRAQTVIEGAGNPNPGGANGNHRLRPNPQEMTFFWSQPSKGALTFFHDGKPQWCGCSWYSNTANGHDVATCKMASPENYRIWRKGFLMNSNTAVRMLLYDGSVEDGMDACDGGLGGGGAFELPGCLTSYPAPQGVVGCGVMEDNKTPVHNGTAFVTGDGKAVENVVIEDVRLADGLAGYGVKSMLAVWSAFPPDGSVHRNVTIRRLVSMGSGKDGMNIHGPVDGFTGEDMYIERANDDTFAFWGSGGAPFYNNRTRNIKLARLFARYDKSWDPYWGTCLTSFGFAGAFDINHLMCCQDHAGDAPGPNQTCDHIGYNGTFQSGQHAVTFQPAFAANYSGAIATFRGNVMWWNTTTNTNNCRSARHPQHSKAVAFCPKGFGPSSAPKLNVTSQWCQNSSRG